jgi:hypothetical protein
VRAPHFSVEAMKNVRDGGYQSPQIEGGAHQDTFYDLERDSAIKSMQSA